MVRAIWILVLALLFMGVAAIAAEAPKTVTLKGQMLCMSCDLVSPYGATGEKDKAACSPIFKARDGKVYTLAGTPKGKEVGAKTMHEQYVEIKGRVMPNSQILEVQSYKVTKKVKPKTPETTGWYNF